MHSVYKVLYTILVDQIIKVPERCSNILGCDDKEITLIMSAILPSEWICRKCNELKPSHAFADQRLICRDCINKSVDFNRKRANNLKVKYGLTKQQYDNLLCAQEGVCAACGQEETQFDIRVNAFKKLAVDHDHSTGKVRGLLCHNCNTALGLMQEDPTRIRMLKEYIENFIV